MHAFQACALNHSAISPHAVKSSGCSGPAIFKYDNLTLKSDTVRAVLKYANESKPSLWQITLVPNLIRSNPSGILFARIRIEGKLIRRSLKTKIVTVGKL